jgi:hypothetical protein
MQERDRRTGIQLIAIAHPSQSRFLDVVESYEIVVSWYAMDRLDTGLLEAFKEVLELFY